MVPEPVIKDKQKNLKKSKAMEKATDTSKGTILIADSCAGGLGVLKYFLDWAGEYQICYLADGKVNPLGIKTKSEIENAVMGWIRKFQKDRRLELVVVACNTASIAIEDKIKFMAGKFKVPIVTMIDGVEGLLKNNLKKLNDSNILLAGTEYTIHSGKYQELLAKINPEEIYPLSATKTEKFIAKGMDKDRDFKKEVLEELSKYQDNKIDTIFLGCTCFEFAKNQMRKIYGKKVLFLNPGQEVSEKAKGILKNSLRKTSVEKVKIYATGNLELEKRSINLISRKIFDKNVEVKALRIDI
jgi:glutamate racemase